MTSPCCNPERAGNQQVTPEQTVSYLIANTQVGSRVPLEIIRGGRRQTIQVTVGERPTEQELARLGGGGGTTQGAPDGGPAVTPQRTLGLSLAPVTPELARAANLPPNVRGVIITSVDANSDASDEGLQRGDVIISVNGNLVTSPAQVVTAVEGARRAGRPSVLLLVKRGNSPEAFVGIDISGR